MEPSPNGDPGPPQLTGPMPVVKLTLDGVQVRTGWRTQDGARRKFIEIGPFALVLELPFTDEGARTVAGGLVGIELATSVPPADVSG